MPDAPNKGSNTRSKPAGLGNQVAELDRLGLLPTPSASDGSGGKQQSFDSLRSGRHQTHLTNLPRLLDLEAEQPPLLRTPQAQVTEPKPGIKLEGRRPSDPQVGLADQVLADFHGDDGAGTGQPVPLFPTPDTGVSPNGHGRRGGRPGNGRQSGASLDAVVRDLGGTHDDGGEPLLLPTPMARHSGNTPENHLAKKPGRSVVTDLAILVENGLLETGGELPPPAVAPDVPLLPTPQTRDSTGGKPEAVHRGRGYGADLNDIAAAGLLDQGEMKLLPTPTTMDDREKRTTHAGGNPTLQGALCGINPVDARRLGLEDDEHPLLPTPMARDHRTGSPAGMDRNSPNLSSINALLPTPAAWDTGGGRQHTARPTRNGKVLSEVLRDLLTTPDYNTAADQEDGDGDGVELMPTPMARDWKGTPSSVHRNGGLNRAIDQLVAEAPPPEPEPETVPEPSGDQYTLFPIGGEPEPEPGPLLPTPVAQDGNGHMQDPSADVGNDGRSVSLADVVSRLPEGAGPLLPTPTVGARWVRNSPGEMARVNPALGAVIADLAENGEASRFYGGDDDPLLPTPVAGDPYSNANPESRKRRGYGPDLPDVASNYFGNLPSSQGEVVFPAGDVPLLPTPMTINRTSQKAQTGRPTSGPSRGGPSYGLEDVITSLTDSADTARDSRSGPSMEQAIEIAQGVLPREFDSWEELPAGWQPDSELFPTPNAEQSRGTRSPEGVARRMARGDKQTSLEDAITLLPTPSAQDGNRGGSNPQKMRDANHMVKLIDAVLGGDLKPEEELLPTPGAADAKRGSADLARADRPGAGGDDLITATTKTSRAGQWGKYAPAVARWEALTRPAPAPTEPNKNGNPRLTARFSEWLLGWPEGWVTDPEIGISRSGQLRLIGNGVVPQQAAAALVILLKMLDSEEPDAESETRHVS